MPIATIALTWVALMTTPVDLPSGNAPAPVPAPYFPSRMHAFVWRNWQLVPLARMAAVVGAKPEELRRMGRAMGLQGPPRITADTIRRSYITVIRRNWHLLPYSQLLQLLGWSEEQMAFTLREDDFLYIKLGSHKPRCEPLRYRPPTQEERAREEEIGAFVRRQFPEGVGRTNEPLFAFVRDLSTPPPPAAEPISRLDDGPRYCYSYFALYGDPLLETGADPYPDGLLARLARSGVNGVWLQGVLYRLAPFPWDPSQSRDAAKRLANLRRLVARAKKQGVGVYLYLNEPRAMPLAFYEKNPALRGITEGDHAALCTSVPEVRDYLRNSVAHLCREVPDLAGLFTITASENLTNCWSHGAGAGCPRCAARPPAEVIAEVNRVIQEGIRLSGARTRLIAWDWGWNDAWAPDAIRLLPKEVMLQSVSEWSIPIRRGGVESIVGEYSLSQPGPGPRASRHWSVAREQGLATVAKIQAGNTWELSAVPYIPAVALAAEHAANLRQARIDGLMLGWTLGGYPSPNLEVVAEVGRGYSAAEALERVARRRFGERHASTVVRAWQTMSEAFREFPYHIQTVYTAPLQMGPANLLWLEPTGYPATMSGFPYDDLDAWRAVYPPDIFAAQLEKVAEGFARGAKALDEAAAEARGEEAWESALKREAGVAHAAANHFQAVAHQTRFVHARRVLAAAETSEQRAAAIAELRRLLDAEMRLATEHYRLQTADSRIGFEASNHYFYVPVDLAEKALCCQYLLEKGLAGDRR